MRILKTCPTCGETKEADKFSRSRDGRYCKKCINEYNRKYIATHPIQRECKKKYKANNREYFRNKQKEYNARYPEKLLAHRLARKEYGTGHAGECGWCAMVVKELELHHPDYTKPLEVIALCINCHSKWHSEERSIGL